MNKTNKVISPISLFLIIVIFLNLNCLNKQKVIGDYTRSIISGGLERTYLIHIPPSYDKTKPMPLLIALHGGGGTGAGMERLTCGGFNTLSDKEGFIVVYPDGIEKHWNDSRPDVKYHAHKEKVDDVGFISALIDHLIKEMNIDKKRVYVTGISNGAMMSHYLAFELSEKIAAIAPVAGGIPEGFNTNRSTSRPISVLAINSTNDKSIPWEGGEITFCGKRGKVLSVADTIKYWVTNNGCPSSPVITQEPDKDPQDGTLVRREVYGGGRDETEVILYAVEGGGHTWPNGYQYLAERFVGKTTKDIDANEIIWGFFKKHTR